MKDNMNYLYLFFPDGKLFARISLTNLETKLVVENFDAIARLCGLEDKLEIVHG